MTASARAPSLGKVVMLSSAFLGYVSKRGILVWCGRAQSKRVSVCRLAGVILCGG